MSIGKWSGLALKAKYIITNSVSHTVFPVVVASVAS